MTEAEILALFRRGYGRYAYQPEQHLVHCPQLQVLRFKVTGEGSFDSLLTCPHSRPLGYSVGATIEPYAVIEKRHADMLAVVREHVEEHTVVDLGPVEPWPFAFIPKTAVEGLELWHAAWERDHPELLGVAGPSFYRPELDRLLLKRQEGLTAAEAGRRLQSAFGRGGWVSSDLTIHDLGPFPAAMTTPKPVPPPGPGAGSPIRH